MMEAGRLLFPALRWHQDTGFSHEQITIDRALRIGVGGFCIFGGEADAVRHLVDELRASSQTPLLVASDLERGAGQQFAGATQLPPLAALGSLDEPDTTRLAAAVTASEALALGVNWVYAPVADVDLEPRNPIVGTRSFGTDSRRVARHVAAWIGGCHAQGALCCAKHFPGHGRTTEDSHAVLPEVTASRKELESDLTPFRAAVDCEVDGIMTAHVAFPSLDPSGAPATLSRNMVTGLLREEWHYSGLVVTDALIMDGVLKGRAGEVGASLTAIAAGCDALLYPTNLDAVATAVEAEVGRAIPRARLEESLERIDKALSRAPLPEPTPVGLPADLQWATELAARTCVIVRGQPRAEPAFEFITIDDDVGGPYPPPSRAVFPRALHDAGCKLSAVSAASGKQPVLLAVYSDIRAWKGRPGLSKNAFDAVTRAVAARPDASIVLFGHPRLAEGMPGAHVLSAWGGEAIMQRAAPLRLTGQSRV